MGQRIDGFPGVRRQNAITNNKYNAQGSNDDPDHLGFITLSGRQGLAGGAAQQRPLLMLFAAEVVGRRLLLAQMMVEGRRVFGQRIQMSAEHFDLLDQCVLLRH